MITGNQILGRSGNVVVHKFESPEFWSTFVLYLHPRSEADEEVEVMAPFLCHA